jgi:hypothetical protein
MTIIRLIYFQSHCSNELFLRMLFSMILICLPPPPAPQPCSPKKTKQAVTAAAFPWSCLREFSKVGRQNQRIWVRYCCWGECKSDSRKKEPGINIVNGRNKFCARVPHRRRRRHSQFSKAQEGSGCGITVNLSLRTGEEFYNVQDHKDGQVTPGTSSKRVKVNSYSHDRRRIWMNPSTSFGYFYPTERGRLTEWSLKTCVSTS